MKLTIIGAGKVGATLAYTLLERGVNQINLVDIREEYLKGIKMDLQSAFPFSKVSINKKIDDSDIIIVTAGFPRTPEMKSRDELFEKNKKVMDEILGNKKFKKTAKIIVVTNPADKLTEYARKITGVDVIEFGTQLDSNRLKYLTQEQDAYVTGRHNEDMKLHCKAEGMDSELKNFASEVIKKSGGTVFGPAKALADLIKSLY